MDEARISYHNPLGKSRMNLKLSAFGIGGMRDVPLRPTFIPYNKHPNQTIPHQGMHSTVPG